MSENQNTNYKLVEFYSLKVGMLIERPIYAHLTANDKYILLAKALHPLEQSAYDKMRRFTKLYSPLDAIDQQYPKLPEAAFEIKKAFEENKLAPFELNLLILQKTEWLIESVLDFENTQGLSMQSIAPVIFFHRVFNVPVAETLQYLADQSIVTYEKALKRAATAGLIALWLGFNNSKFLTQYVSAAFCEEVGFFEDGIDVANATKKDSLTKITKNQIPGVTLFEKRFQTIMTQELKSLSLEDELNEIIEFARALNGETHHYGPHVDRCRIARKLEQLLLTAKMFRQKAEEKMKQEKMGQAA